MKHGRQFFEGTLMQIFENLPISSCSYKDNTLKISHFKSYEFSSYIHVNFAKCLFINIQKQ